MSSQADSAQSLLARLEAMANPVNVEGMARYGIRPSHALGISVTSLRGIAKEIGRDHQLAAQLWESGIHEARILATIIDEPLRVTKTQMESWVEDFDSWDVCDQCCGNLFCRTPYAVEMANAWTGRSEEFVRRAGFVLIAYLAVHDKKAPNETFVSLMPLLMDGADDERNFVKKAVSWAFRQIGKRNPYLHAAVIDAMPDLIESSSSSKRWVGKDVTKELLDPKTQARLAKRFP